VVLARTRFMESWSDVSGPDGSGGEALGRSPWHASPHPGGSATVAGRRLARREAYLLRSGPACCHRLSLGLAYCLVITMGEGGGKGHWARAAAARCPPEVCAFSLTWAHLLRKKDSETPLSIPRRSAKSGIHQKGNEARTARAAERATRPPRRTQRDEEKIGHSMIRGADRRPVREDGPYTPRDSGELRPPIFPPHPGPSQTSPNGTGPLSDS
jgi:hypothetical protein